MKIKLNNTKLLFISSVLLSLYFYLSSIFLTIFDKNYNFKWVSFTFWIFSILTIPAYFTIKNLKGRKFHKVDKLLIFILLLSSVFCFAYLSNYPFVSIYDQVRDGGLNARQILDGTIKNIFSYGRYSSHGLVIPTIDSFFYLFFKNSVLTFRFPAALFTFLSVGILYITIRGAFGRKAAFWSSAVLSTLPLVLYYGRTEVVVVYSLFLFTLIINRILVLVKKQSSLNYILLATLLGFSSGFHTSIRTAAVLTLLGMIGINLIRTIRARNSVFLKNIVLSVVFFIIGFGPRILFTSFDIFFQIRSFSLTNSLPISTAPFAIMSSYIHSLLVYVLTPTISTHYQDFHPILGPVWGVFFIIGFIFILKSQDSFSKILALFALLLPLTNSAVTDTINSDNRLAPLFILSAILTGLGISYFLTKFKSIKVRSFFGLIILLQLIYLGISFFTQEKASKQYSNIDYLSMYTALYLKNDNDYKLTGSVCLFANNKFLEYSKLLHVQEQYEFFAPGTIRVIENNKIPSNEIYISKNCDNSLFSDYKKTTYCDIKRKFICGGSSIILHVEKAVKTKKINIQDMKNSVIINPAPVFIP